MNILKGYRLDLIPENPYFYIIIGLNLQKKHYLNFEGKISLIFIAKTLKNPQKSLFSGFFFFFSGFN